MHIVNDYYGVTQIQKLAYRQRNEGTLTLDNVTISLETKPPIRARIGKFIRSLKQ